jgi:Ca2+-binding RTX toxin-like protein
MLLAVAVIGVTAAVPAEASGDVPPVGVWQGEKNVQLPPYIPYGESGYLTVVIDQDDDGNVMLFVHDSEAQDCGGAPGVFFSRGYYREDLEGYEFPWDRMYCLDGTWADHPVFWFYIWDYGDYIQTPTDQIWRGWLLCDPDPKYVPEAMNVITGTEDADTINGTRGPDLICGLGGDDKIWGRGGDDIIIGGDGDDELYGNNGMDILWGDMGADVLYGGFHTDGVFGNDGDDEVRPQAGHDYGYGGYGVDILDGFFGHDRLEGGPGDDDAWGRSGNDLLLGGTGDDFLSGGAGPRDAVDGEDGSDTCNAETETACES